MPKDMRLPWRVEDPECVVECGVEKYRIDIVDAFGVPINLTAYESDDPDLTATAAFIVAAANAYGTDHPPTRLTQM